ncbi:MAG TPA: alkaline phosphatase family protein, partial [Chloroflexota bacterium]|nr:alkaline phosphatase family protein [Chloroflexota bacterium]
MPLARRAIVVGMDGASMELVRRMVDEGQMPNVGRLMAEGAWREVVGVFPTLTPPGWTALWTGSWPGTHEVMDFNIRALGQPLSQTVWGINTRLSKSEYLWNALERGGKRAILVKQEMSWPPTLRDGVQVEGTGPGVSNHHQIAGYHLFVAGRWARRRLEGHRDPETLDPSALQMVRDVDPVELGPGPDGTREAELVLRPLVRSQPRMRRGREGEPKRYRALIRDGRCRVLGAEGQELANLAQGEWSDWRRDRFVIDGQPVEGHVRFKLITLTGDSFELFVPQVWPVDGDWAYPAGLAAELTERTGPFLQNPMRDALGVIDDDTYFELLEYHHEQLARVAHHLAATRPWELLVVETHASDYTSHFFLQHADEPFRGPKGSSGAPSEVVVRCRRGVERTFASMDRLIGRLTELRDKETVFAVISDHGGTPTGHQPVDVGQVLVEAGLTVLKPDPPSGPEREAAGAIDWSKTRAAAVGLVHVFVNLRGREPDGIVPPEEYARVQREVIDALLDYRHPATGERAFALALTRADAEMVNLWGDLVG